MSAKSSDDVRAGIRYAIAWLHRRVEEMNDPHAKQVLNSAAFSLGVHLKHDSIVIRRCTIPPEGPDHA